MDASNASGDFASIFFGPMGLITDRTDELHLGLNTTLHPIYENLSKDTEDSEENSLYLIIPITIVYALIFVAGVIGNVSTCIVIMRNKCMHTATNYYLFSLAISDMVLLLSGMPNEISSMWYPGVYLFGEGTCRILGLSSETSTNATVLTITAFTVERYIAICHPFLSHTMSKLSRVVKFIIAIWFVALFLALPQALQFGLLYSVDNGKLRKRCTVKWEIFEHGFIISSFLFFVVPMTIITVLYVLIGLKLRTSRLLGSTKKSSLNSNQEQNGHARSYKNNMSQRRAIKMLVAVALSFFICWAPFHAQRLLAAVLSKVDNPEDFIVVYEILNYISGVLYFLSTTINPFLYNIMSNKFREAFKHTIAHRCCIRRQRKFDKCNNRLSCRSADNRPPYISKTLPTNRTRLASANSTTKFHQDSNKCYHHNREHLVSAITVPKDEEVQIANLVDARCPKRRLEPSNSFADKLFKSTKSIFKPKIDDSRSLSASWNRSPKRMRYESTDSAKSHSISNSSLQDLDEEEFTGRELASFMEEVNQNII